jgi:fibronectin type 3 domain-containing protein
MKRFRLARRCLPGFAPGGPAVSPGRPAIRPGRRWLWSLAAAGLAGVLAGWPAVLTCGSVAAPPADGPGLVLTAMDGPQARVLNPGPPTGLTATAGNGQVTLSWTAPAANGGAAIIGYDVHRGTSSHGESASPVNTSLIAGTSYTVTGLSNGTTYYFTADAVNDAELHSAPSAEASATPVASVTAPGSPTGLTATAGDGQVSLMWKAPASDGGTQVTGYHVYEGTSQAITGKPVASPGGTSVTVKNLGDGTTYYFKVTAVNKAGEGPASGTVSATPAAAVTKPGAPAGLTAAAGNGRVTLSWTAPGSDGGAGISGYLIYQGTSPGGESRVPVNGTPVRATSYTVTGLADGTAYYFTVAAVNDAKLQGSDSGEASATPVAITSSASASTPASASASATAGNGAPGAPGAPGPPTGLTATGGDAQVSLTWTAPTAGGSPPARYDVYEGTSSGFALGTPVGSTTGTTATVAGLADGTAYYFVVTAVDAQGKTSGASGEVSAEPTGTAVLTSKQVPKQVIVSLAAIAIGATLGALALAGQWLRRRSLRSHSPAAPPAEVRAVPEPGRPGPVSIHEIGIEETYTVRLEPLAAAIITTIEELTP